MTERTIYRCDVTKNRHDDRAGLTTVPIREKKGRGPAEFYSYTRHYETDLLVDEIGGFAGGPLDTTGRTTGYVVVDTDGRALGVMMDQYHERGNFMLSGAYERWLRFVEEALVGVVVA